MRDSPVSGLALARAFYTDAVAPLVRAPHAACLLGEGSEVLGFDTERSRDHEWGPRVQIFVASEHIDGVRERMRELPPRFNGLDTAWFSLATGTVAHHVEVTTLSDWTVAALGIDPRDAMDAATWLGLSQQRLLQVTAGEVFHDEAGELTRIRARLSWYPDDVWAWTMCSGWHLIGKAESMRGRCIETGDVLGERLLTARLCRLIMELAFLQERRYWPYEKWFGAAFRELNVAAELGPLLRQALAATDPAATAALRAALQLLGHRHNVLGLGAPVEPSYGPFEVGINDAVRPYETINAGDYVRSLREVIAANDLRHFALVGSIDQLTHGDDALVNYTDWPARLTREYRDAM
ncbi:DUF4037 domain-containing protein [Curtobacterium sp. PhB115]|uniref:DUF4037 domain-containing protein n=1 Tax=Curtobacterium sp. PhB115 TaxID=2485173 RepID=UPI000F4CFFEE|nr:DUF4037 domain-containing protein [Curtobacterium sp. PhB115]ROP72732.1 uncharacterized protein DUF4037 [Curtobacterium sp. PhB115]